MTEVKLVFISDTHQRHDQVRVPSGDILIHSGDCTNDKGRFALREFCKWFESQPAPEKILIAGNHDWAFELWPDLAREMVKEYAPSVHYLQDSGVTIQGLKFWGSPYQPAFNAWAFNLPRGPELKRHWDMIPDDTDVLVTHGPPYGYLDWSMYDQEHCGCRDLYEAVLRVQPQIHAFGHIHLKGGEHKKLVHDSGNSTMLINASCADEQYAMTHAPQIFSLAV